MDRARGREERNRDEVCEICGEPRYDLGHNNTLNHRFHFLKWVYNEYRKPLWSDRHGVILEVQAERINNFHFDFEYIKGKYVTKVTPEQLCLHSNTISFKCKIKNTSKDPIFLTSVNLIHPYDYFRMVHSPNFNQESTTQFHQIKQGCSYTFRIIFSTDVPNNASYKIPLACDIQTCKEEKNDCFTIVRTFLTIVDDRDTQLTSQKKSPFTSKAWEKIEYIPTTKQMRYQDRFEVPTHLVRLLSHGLRTFSKINISEEQELHRWRDTVSNLTSENYNRFWHILLWMEERGQAMMLTKYNMEGVTLQILPGEILSLQVPGLEEKRPSVIVSDFIQIRIHADHTAYTGYVSKVQQNTVEISHVDDELFAYLESNPDSPMDVSFKLGRLAFERMHRAVDQVVQTGMVAKLFPPKRIPRSTHIVRPLQDSDFINKTICHNVEQRNAVEKIVNTLHDFPYIVFGPPGTGKTVTIVEAILQIKKQSKKKILVCAPANAACDMLASKLIEHNCSSSELIRIHSMTRDMSTIPEDLRNYSNIENDEFIKVDEEKLPKYRIVVTTLILIGRFYGCYKPDCVFIDEAAQASEPETCIPLSLLTVGKQVVLAGDPKQLGPMVTKAAEEFGLGTSLLQRLMAYDMYSLNPNTGNYNSDFITMLRLNFRSHADVLLISNDLFYHNLLEPRSQEAHRDPIVNVAIYPRTTKSKGKTQKGRAIEFCSVSSKEEKEGASPSFFNMFEAKMVVKYVRALHNLSLPDAYKVRTDQIGVITPYKRQVHKIKEKLKHAGFQDVEVGTTESFQGREKRIIIISSVRAQHSLLLHDKKYNLGFVKHDQRFNVALTRAISKLIVIGNPLVLRTDEKWDRYTKLCHEYGTYFGNRFADDDERFKQQVLDKTRRFKYIDDQYNH